MRPEAYRLNYEWEETHWWFLARRDILLSMIHHLIERRRLPSPPLDILDYGCGTGALTRALELFGTVDGVDESEEAVSYCQQRGMKNVRFLPSPCNLPSGAYDLIGSFDVLEHAEDDSAVLRELNRSLRPAGTLLLTVPALRVLWSGEDVVSNHQRRYSRNEIIQQVESAGFNSIKCSYFNTFLFAPILAARLFNRWFRPATLQRSDVAPVHEPVNTLLRHIFSSERHLLKYMNLPIGVSLLLAAEKSNPQASASTL